MLRGWGGLNTEGTTPRQVPKAPPHAWVPKVPPHAWVPNLLNHLGLLLHLSGLPFLSRKY